ncbi:MAG: ArsI/CadI family heavy metal resistance metalloenzyme [Alphaproteobacteria bacterium]
MSRFHVHVRVKNVEESIGFYRTLFGAEPAVRKPDYAKWMLEDPKVNFAISGRSQSAGIDHIGIQVETSEDLNELAGRLKAAGETTFDEKNASCCYAKSDKNWVHDPSGIRWETFHTLGEATTYGEDTHIDERAHDGGSSCCRAS